MVNKSLMYELDQYKQTYGEIDLDAPQHKPFLALSSEAAKKEFGADYSPQKQQPQSVFQPTEVPLKQPDIDSEEPSAVMDH